VNAVRCEAVEKRFGPVRALAGVSTELPVAALYLLTGANGAGKSTLLRVVAGLTRPTRGRVEVLGRDPFGSGAAAGRARVGYLGPEPGLYGDLTVRENLEFCARLLGAAPARVGRVISALGLEDERERRVRVLSTGYRRRAGLARALVAEPDLLLLDEPWSGLDGDAADLLAQLLVALRRRGGTAVVASHSIGAYANLFDHSLHIEAGRLEPPGAA
jgi:ABC-type multidrug transport system ATPase subunit